MNEEVLEVCISRLYREYVRRYGRDPDDAEVLDMARWAWRCKSKGLPMLVFAEADGVIKGVFGVDRWFRCGEAMNNPGLKPNVDPNGTRKAAVQRDIADNRKMAFVGHISPRAGQYIGQIVPRLDNWHTFRYVTLTNGQLIRR